MLEGCVSVPPSQAERYRREGYWQDEVLSDLLRVPPEWAGRVAVVDPAGRHTFGDLDGRAQRLAAGLQGLGVAPRDRVLVQLPNSADFVVACVALFRLGAVPVLALAAHREAELTYLATYSAAVALITAAPAGARDGRGVPGRVLDAAPTLRHVVVYGATAADLAPDGAPFVAAADLEAAQPREHPRPDPYDVAFFLLSGGTTGMPKLIPRGHAEYCAQLRGTAAELGFDETGAYLAAVPVAHNAALGCPGVLGALLVGARVAMAPNPSPEVVFPLMEAEGITLTTVMPAILGLWVELAELFGAYLPGLTIEVGGAMLDPALARQVRPALGATLTHWFGMAEGILCFTRPGDGDELAATTQGTPLFGADELRVVDEDGQDVPAGEVGELLVRGPCTLRGYYAVPDHNREVFTPDGFLRTGDLVRIDAGGRLVVSGRIKDVINRGGEKVVPAEVEDQLRAHPAVKQVAVIAVPDRSLGEKSCAVVVPEGEPPTLGQLRTFLTSRGLAAFKLPDRLQLAQSLPRTQVGKIDKRALAEGIGAGPAGAGPGASPERAR